MRRQNRRPKFKARIGGYQERRDQGTKRTHNRRNSTDDYGLCKQRSESIEMFQKGGRNDLVEKEQADLKVLQQFLPEPLSDDEIISAIRITIRESGAQGLQDLGKVMKEVMPKVSGRSDGKRVNELAREILRGA
jgi:uncharacterized protein YqeY